MTNQCRKSRGGANVFPGKCEKTLNFQSSFFIIIILIITHVNTYILKEACSGHVNIYIYMHLFPFPSCPFRGRHSKSFSPTSSSATPTPWLSFTRSKNILCGLTLFLQPGTYHQHPLPSISVQTISALPYFINLTCTFVQVMHVGIVYLIKGYFTFSNQMHKHQCYFSQKSSLDSILLRLHSLFKKRRNSHTNTSSRQDCEQYQ